METLTGQRRVVGMAGQRQMGILYVFYLAPKSLNSCLLTVRFPTTGH